MATRTEPSFGELVTQATHQLSDLVRTEVQLAKAEITQEVGRVGRSAGLFTGAGTAAWLALLFLSLAAMFGLGEVVPLWAAALLVAVAYGAGAGALALAGKSTLDKR